MEISNQQGEYPFLMSYSLQLDHLLRYAFNVRLWLERFVDSRISMENVDKAFEGFDIMNAMREKSKKFAEATMPEDAQRKIIDGFANFVSKPSQPNDDQDQK
jgi:hypothetical protein